MKKKIILTAILIIGCFLIINPVCQSIYKFEIYEKRQSPCKEYTLLVYRQSRSIFFNIENSYYSRECYVVLKDKNGKTLAKPYPICSCLVMKGDLGTNWDYDKKRVYFSMFSYIDLSTYKIHCNES